MTDSANIQYTAVIQNVKEVALFGTADLTFWQNQLQAENLSPYRWDGKAALAITATELVYMGRKFREVTLSVYVCNPQDPNQPGDIFLIHAFNSSRMFAWMERTLFQTPYYPGKIQVEDKTPASFALDDGQGVVLNAKMSGVVPRWRGEDERWQGAIHLPKRMTKNRGGFFYAKLGGHTETFAFSPSMDTIELKASPPTPVLQWFIDSNFTATEWRIRHSAEHSKSKTYYRTR